MNLTLTLQLERRLEHHAIPEISSQPMLGRAMIRGQLAIGLLVLVSALGCAHYGAKPRTRGHCSSDSVFSVADVQAMGNTGVRRHIVSLACDGTLDTITIAWDSAAPKARIERITVRRGGHTLISRGESDELEYLVGLADVDGDGVRDLLLAWIDQTSVVGSTMLIRPDRLAGSHFGNPDSSAMAFIPQEDGGVDSCLAGLLPRVIHARDTTFLGIATGDQQRSRLDCFDPPFALFRVEQDSFVYVRTVNLGRLQVH